MFFIDYVALLLVNMTAGFVVLAFFLLYGLSGERKRWATPFAMAGLVAFLCAAPHDLPVAAAGRV